MSNQVATGIRVLLVTAICGAGGMIVSQFVGLHGEARTTAERVTRLEVVVPRIEKVLDAIAAEQSAMRKDVAAEIQALRRDIVDSGQYWGRALRPARAGGE